MPNPPALPRPWPILRSLQGWTPAAIGPDLVAGLTLAAIAVPEQMATARLGGFAPQVGLAAFVAASVGFALLGADRRLSAGADSTIAPIFAGSLALLAVAGAPHYAAQAAALALMVGVLLILAGALKLGWIADLSSTPVITGFMAGISLHIALSQAPALLGLPEGAGDVYQRLAALWAQAGQINLPSLAIGLSVFALTLGADKLSARIPGALIALLAVAGAASAFGLEAHEVVVLGPMSAAPARPGLPSLDWEGLIPLVGLAFVVALVVMMQTAATTRSFSSKGEDPDVDRDFVGVGAAGVLAGLFGTFPVNASPPRTAIVAETGGRTGLAGLLAALAVLALTLFGGRLLAHAPTAALAGVLLYIAQRIFHLDTLADIPRRTPAEFALAVSTTGLIFALPIQTGVAIGIFMSLAHGVFTITRVRPIRFERVPDTTVWWPSSAVEQGEREPGILVMGFQAPLSFLNAYEFRRGVARAIADGQARLFVLEASSIVEVDFTAAAILSEVIDQARAAGTEFAVARLESVRAQAAFDRFGVTERLGRDRLFHSVDEAIRALKPSDCAAR